MELEQFVLTHLPEPPARVLELGCGAGELARVLARRGYDVTAIDPDAPEGPLFRRVSLEEFSEPGPFDAVVAGRSLHHVADLEAGVAKLASLLRSGGVVVLDEYAKEEFDEPTAGWYYDRRLALAASGGRAAPESLAACVREWREDDAEIHSSAAMRAALDSRFRLRVLVRVPYLYRELADDAAEAFERALIDAGAIRAVGFRYVGEDART